MPGVSCPPYQDRILVTLTASEIVLANTVLGMIEANNARSVRYDPDSVVPGANMDAQERFRGGAYGELAVAKHFGLYWNGNVGDRGAVDVGPYQVRTVRENHHRLWVWPHEDPHQIFISTLVNVPKAPTVVLRGWAFGADMMVDKYYTDLQGTGRYSFVLPNAHLRPMSTILDFD